LPDIKKHFSGSPHLAGVPPGEHERHWGEFEPQLKSFLRTNPLVNRNMAAWRRGRPTPQRGNLQAPGPEFGVNDSLRAMNTALFLFEAATLGLGRTGDAPDIPVPGLGAQSAQRAPTTAPAPASPATGTPPAGRPQALTAGLDVNVVENGKTLTGKVSSAKPGDQNVEVSFPTGEKRVYNTAAVTVIQPGQTR
jgi:hypothetical protein